VKFGKCVITRPRRAIKEEAMSTAQALASTTCGIDIIIDSIIIGVAGA
jgi:hypothetical protein